MSLRFGVCTSFDNIPALKSADYDYLEFGFNNLVNLTDEEFEEARAVKECGYNRRLSPKAAIGPNLTSALSVREKSSKLLNRLTERLEFFKKIGSLLLCYD